MSTFKLNWMHIIFFLWFLVAKEIIFYGEERIIVMCFVFLVLTGFSLGFHSVNQMFDGRNAEILQELTGFFSNILEVLHTTRSLLNQYIFSCAQLLRLFEAVLNEIFFFFNCQSTALFGKKLLAHFFVVNKLHTCLLTIKKIKKVNYRFGLALAGSVSATAITGTKL